MNLPAAAIQRARIRSMVRILVEIGPEIPDRHLATIARLGLVSFAFDDLVDQQDIEISDLKMRAEQLSECAAGHYVPEIAFDPIARMLLDGVEDLRANPAADALWADWTLAARRMFTGIVEHREIAERMWRGEEVRIDELLEVGGRSIGLEVFAVAAWIALGSPRLVAARESLWAVTRELAEAARLANDLITVKREQQERGANLLFLTGRDRADVLLRWVARALETAERMVAALPLEARASGRFTLNLGRRIVEQYAACDFHEQAGSASRRFAQPARAG